MDMEARAINRYVSTSPTKMRLVVDLIRGKSVNEALHILHFSPKHAARTAEKVLRSAVSNLQNKDESGRIDPDHLVVKEAFVDGGMMLKRISPAPMGRAYRIRKRSNHITIVVEAKMEGKKKEEGKGKRPKKEEPKAGKAPSKAETKTTEKKARESSKAGSKPASKKTRAKK
jgi:large subunit ribosomal protein L22